MSYAKKVQKDKGSTFLSLREQKNAENAFGNFAEGQKEEPKLSGKQKATLIVFALAFVVMIIGFIPWGEFGVTLFKGWSDVLTGAPLGEWYFYDSALWFLILSIIIAVINGLGEKGYVDAFVSGAADMVGVLLVIAIARGASILKCCRSFI